MCVYRQVELTQYNYNELLMICKASRVICIFSQFDQLDTHFALELFSPFFVHEHFVAQQRNLFSGAVPLLS